jgi:hypothetical protein
VARPIVARKLESRGRAERRRAVRHATFVKNIGEVLGLFDGNRTGGPVTDDVHAQDVLGSPRSLVLKSEPMVDLKCDTYVELFHTSGRSST